MRRLAIIPVFLISVQPGFSQKNARSNPGRSFNSPAPAPHLRVAQGQPFRSPPSAQRWMAGQSFETLQRMSPEARKKALESLPQRQREQIAAKLERWDRMEPARREALLERYRRFQQLPPEKQEQIRDVGRQLQELSSDRRALVRGAMNRMRQLPEEERLQKMGRPAFRERFTPAELEIIRRGAEISLDEF